MADIFDFYVYDDRSIQFKLAEPILLEDKDVTEFRFRIPKSLNGFDMTSWEWWFIFVNPKGTKYTTLLELTDDEDEPDEYSVATYTVGYGFSGIVGTVRFSLEALYVEGESIVNEWHTKTYRTTVTDTLQGHRAIIPEPDGHSSTGITENVKQALLQIARKVAYIDEHGQTYYDALYNALYAVMSVKISPTSVMLNAIGNTKQLSATTIPSGAGVTWTSSDTSVATVSSDGLVTSVAWGNAIITATAGNKTASCSVSVAEVSVRNLTADYIQSGTVYDDATLDSLKSDLTVSVEYSDGTSAVLADTDYALNGTLTVGTSIIEVSYGNMVTTFSVTVTKAVVLHSITYKLTDCISSSSVVSVEDGKGYSTSLATRSGYSISTATVTMGGVDVTSGVYNSGSIIINRVTGDIVITAVATKTVNSITATYTQSGTVYDTDTLDSLKSDLVVTANYSDGTSETVTDYTLSGTLAEGTSVVTVSYGGKTDTFNVTVTPEVSWNYTMGMPADNGFTRTVTESADPVETIEEDGLLITVKGPTAQYIQYTYDETQAQRIFEAVFKTGTVTNQQIFMYISTDSQNTGIGLRIQHSGNYKGIYVINASAIGEMILVTAITLETQYKVRIEIVNSLANIYVNDTLMLQGQELYSIGASNTRFTFKSSSSSTSRVNAKLISMMVK